MSKIWNILSIDGGGIRGVIPAVLLADLEQRLDQSLVDVFDVFAGTSTGGIIALALVAPPTKDKKRTASELVDLYTNNATEIFPPTVFDLVVGDSGIVSIVKNLFFPKHDEKGLTTILADNFEDLTLSKASKEFFVTSYSVTLDGALNFSRQGVFNGSIPDFSFIEAARSTSAAPTFFRPQNLFLGDITHAIVDGGMYANNPSWPVLKYVTENLVKNGDRINLLSIGTGFQPKIRLPNEVSNKGAAWIPDVIRMLMKNSMKMSEESSKFLVRSFGGQYYRLEVELTQEIIASMDYTSAANIDELRRTTLPIILEKMPKVHEMLKQF